MYLGRLVVRAKTRASSLAPLRAPPRRAAHFGMREIITACVGGAGNKLGARFFRELCAEHGVRPSGFLLDPDDASRGAFARCYLTKCVLAAGADRGVLAVLRDDVASGDGPAVAWILEAAGGGAPV